MTAPEVKEFVPTILVPRRTDSQGEHPRFTRPTVRVKMKWLYNEWMWVVSESWRRGISVESVVEGAIRNYLDLLAAQRRGAKIVIQSEDGSKRQMILRDEAKNKKPDLHLV